MAAIILPWPRARTRALSRAGKAACPSRPAWGPGDAVIARRRSSGVICSQRSVSPSRCSGDSSWNCMKASRTACCCSGVSSRNRAQALRTRSRCLGRQRAPGLPAIVGLRRPMPSIASQRSAPSARARCRSGGSVSQRSVCPASDMPASTHRARPRRLPARLGRPALRVTGDIAGVLHRPLRLARWPCTATKVRSSACQSRRETPTQLRVRRRDRRRVGGDDRADQQHSSERRPAACSHADGFITCAPQAFRRDHSLPASGALHAQRV